MLNWVDETSYCRGEIDKVPRVWVANIPGFSISLEVHRIRESRMWKVSCFRLNVEEQELETEDLEIAKKKAIEVLIANLEQYIQLQNKLKEVLKNTED